MIIICIIVPVVAALLLSIQSVNKILSSGLGNDYEVKLIDGYEFVSYSGVWAIVDSDGIAVYPRNGPILSEWCRLSVGSCCIIGVKPKPVEEWFVIDTNSGEVRVYIDRTTWEERLNNLYGISAYTLERPQ